MGRSLGSAVRHRPVWTRRAWKPGRCRGAVAAKKAGPAKEPAKWWSTTARG